jgi:hypothetical protein
MTIDSWCMMVQIFQKEKKRKNKEKLWSKLSVDPQISQKNI